MELVAKRGKSKQYCLNLPELPPLQHLQSRLSFTPLEVGGCWELMKEVEKKMEAVYFTFINSNRVSRQPPKTINCKTTNEIHFQIYVIYVLKFFTEKASKSAIGNFGLAIEAILLIDDVGNKTFRYHFFLFPVELLWCDRKCQRNNILGYL